ncbi:hypothetical protein H312_02516 [Anncaliia algerae PRA339]|uniref:Uncharacterized protein n=1 Tax=Anncaliia algerae PRA339 TaxID=1288291 RepID=A0A059EZG8_9MICR|nr:hypothetical protein H312_02516 [Anncaliia algerae PRA339]
MIRNCFSCYGIGKLVYIEATMDDFKYVAILSLNF